jgi:hypothetical protein
MIVEGEKTLGRLHDPLQAELNVCRGVLLPVVSGELLEVISEDSLKVVRSMLSISGRRNEGLKSERQLWLHTSLELDGCR